MKSGQSYLRVANAGFNVPFENGERSLPVHGSEGAGRAARPARLADIRLPTFFCGNFASLRAYPATSTTGRGTL